MVDRVKYIINLVIVVMLLATVAIMRDGRVVGCDVERLLEDQESSEVAIETTLADGTVVINTTSIGKDIIGFGGRTPLKIYLRDGVIQKVEPEANSETPSFFDEVIQSGMLERWNGLSLAEAAQLDVDVVSGATYSSSAIIGNVRSAAEYLANVESVEVNPLKNIGAKEIAGLLVILFGVLITLFKSRNQLVMTIQLILNVVVLGFWCGSFLSLATLTAWLSNGVNISMSVVTFALLCVAIVMPFLGRKGSYCQLHCPMGSAQELIGRVPIAKIKMQPRVARLLNRMRYYILVALLFMMWLGVGSDLMNYEIFSAFIISSASTVVLVMAAIFLVLSLFIQRPYCRFVCPTGALITMTQKIK